MRLLAIFTLLISISSCSSNIEKTNDDFAKKYQDEIDKINQQRTPDKEAKNETLFSVPPTREEVAQDLARKAEYFPYSDISLIGDAPRVEFLPNRETYESNKTNNPNSSIPKNVFETNYNLALYPPFRKIGAEFDAIKIPQKDAFGVATNLSDKTYLLAGNNSLKRNIDQINHEKNDLDIEVTKMLVVEKKKILKNSQSIAVSEDQNVAKKIAKPAEENKEAVVKTSISDKTKTIVENVSDFVKDSISKTKTAQQK